MLLLLSFFLSEYFSFPSGNRVGPSFNLVGGERDQVSSNTIIFSLLDKAFFNKNKVHSCNFIVEQARRWCSSSSDAIAQCC